VVALGLVAGVGDLSWRVAGRVGLTRPLHALLVSVATIAVLCAALHGLAVGGAADLMLLRVFGLMLMTCGVWRLRQSGGHIVRTLIGYVRAEWTAHGWVGRALLANTAIVLGALYLTAFAPATDADSLDNHLGVPLDWLRQGRAIPRQDWLSARLTGIGESFSMLGLACGTDAAWAVLQATVFVGFVFALGSLEKSPRERLLIVSAAAVAPVLLFLVPSQKPLLLPAVATTLVIAASSDDTSWRRPHLAAMTLCLAFAAACKHSFLFGAAIGLAVLLRRAPRTAPVLASVSLASLLILLPLYVKNALFYGDPLSPLLERFQATPSPTLVEYGRYLREAGQGLAWPSTAGLFVPTAPGEISSVLGLGILACLAIRPAPAGRPILLTSALLVAVIGAAGQVNGRFLFEPYLWALCGLVGGTRRARADMVDGLLIAQGACTSAAAALLAANLLPGAMTPSARESVMAANAIGYLEAQWLEQLPPDAVVATANRSRAWLPRAFFVAHSPEVGLTSPGTGLDASLRAHGVTALVLPADERLWTSGYADYLKSVCAERSGPPRAFPAASRNPYNRRPGQSVQLYVRRGCAPG
jgi:hypothetical protein